MTSCAHTLIRDFLYVIFQGRCRVISELSEPPQMSTEMRQQQQELRVVFPLIDDARKRSGKQRRTSKSVASLFLINQI